MLGLKHDISDIRLTNTTDGQVHFSQEITIWINGISKITALQFTFRIVSLDWYQKGLDNANEACWYIEKTMIIPKYNQAFIEEKIKEIITHASNLKSRVDAFRYIQSFMKLRTDTEDVDHILDKELFETRTVRYCPQYKIKTIRLLNTDNDYPNDVECCNEPLEAILIDPSSKKESAYQFRVITVGWLEKEIEKNQYFMAQDAIFLRFFDSKLICHMLGSRYFGMYPGF